jgi:hypothetical protein
MLAPLLPFRAGWGGRWLAGSFPVLRPCRHAGRGGGQGTTLTHDNLSYVPSQHSLTLHPKRSQYSQIATSGSPPIPSSLFPSTRRSRCPASFGGSGCRDRRYKAQPHSQSVILTLPGTVVVPVGTRTGDSRIRVSLSNLGGPIKVPE